MNIQRLVDKFLSWPLPESVCSDLCVTSQDKYPTTHRSGTNLLTAEEAKQMFTHVLANQPNEERERAVKCVMDLLFAMRELKIQPSQYDLIKLAQRIRHD